MYKPKPPSTRRPPLAVSPQRARTRHELRSNLPTESPLGSLTKTDGKNRQSRDLKELGIRPELLSMSCEYKALAKMVEDDLGNSGLGTPLASIGRTNCSFLYERGRMYDEYSARRNERLKRKKVGEPEEEKNSLENGVSPLESAKRRDGKKVATERVRKSVPANFSITTGVGPGLRSSVRTNKENKKPASTHGGYNLRSSVDADSKKKRSAGCRS